MAPGFAPLTSKLIREGMIASRAKLKPTSRWTSCVVSRSDLDAFSSAFTFPDELAREKGVTIPAIHVWLSMAGVESALPLGTCATPIYRRRDLPDEGPQVATEAGLVRHSQVARELRISHVTANLLLSTGRLRSFRIPNDRGGKPSVVVRKSDVDAFATEFASERIIARERGVTLVGARKWLSSVGARRLELGHLPHTPIYHRSSRPNDVAPP